MTARRYLAVLRYVTKAMLLAWRNVPEILADAWAPLYVLLCALICLAFVLLLPFLVPLAPLVAWLWRDGFSADLDEAGK
jgi:uncharacterized Tic20 family protein